MLINTSRSPLLFLCIAIAAGLVVPHRVQANQSADHTLISADALDSVTAKFDLAGIRLGMVPADVLRTLKQNGFRLEATNATRADWDARISAEVAERRAGFKITKGQVPSWFEASGPNGETVEVRFIATRVGAKVSSIRFRIGSNQIERERFESDVVRKYGKPTASGYANSLLYCSSQEAKCVAWDSKKFSYLEAGGAIKGTQIFLTIGSYVETKIQAELSAAIEKAAPKDVKSVF